MRTLADTKGGHTSSIRPLPAHPSIAFDRKQAKALLKQLRSGDPVALYRAGEHVARSTPRTNDTWTLADAQRMVAREYGLAERNRNCGLRLQT